MNDQPPIPPAQTPPPEEGLIPGTVVGQEPKPEQPVQPVSLPATPPPPPPAEPVKALPQTPAIEPLQEDGRFGKFIRTALRLLVLSLVMFAAGFLLAYFLLYQPTMKQLEDNRADLQTTSAALETKNAEYLDLKSQYDDLVGNATKIEARASLALALRSLELADLGIEKKNNVVVLTQLQLTRGYVDELLPYLQAQGQQELADELTGLMKTAETELVRDPQAIGPAVSLTKLVDGADLVTGTNGQGVTYSFIVSNAGDVALTNVTLIDTGNAVQGK